MSKSARLSVDFKQASALLKDNHLIWSSDFDEIRLDLSRLIDLYVKMNFYPSALNEIVQKLISTENDLSIGN
jgi:hypothetical protein